MLFICYPACSTCKKAQLFLDALGKPYEVRNIKQQRPTAQELRDWQQKSGLPLRRFFNASGLAYKAQNLREKLPQMTEDEQLALLAADGMLVRRPILVAGEKVLVGFREAEWKAALG